MKRFYFILCLMLGIAAAAKAQTYTQHLQEKQPGKASNAPELFAKPNIDGGLIGGASLKAADFKGIIDAWKK